MLFSYLIGLNKYKMNNQYKKLKVLHFNKKKKTLILK